MTAQFLASKAQSIARLFLFYPHPLLLFFGPRTAARVPKPQHFAGCKQHFPSQLLERHYPVLQTQRPNCLLTATDSQAQRFICAAGSGSILRAWTQPMVLCSTSAITEQGLDPHQTPLPPYPCSDHLSNPLGFSLSALPPSHIYFCGILPQDQAKHRPPPSVHAVTAGCGKQSYHCIYFCFPLCLALNFLRDPPAQESPSEHRTIACTL